MSVNEIRLNIPKEYVIDFEKVKTTEDVIAILSKLQVIIHGDENIKGIEHLVRGIS
jgi:hypothetical protein